MGEDLTKGSMRSRLVEDLAERLALPSEVLRQLADDVMEDHLREIVTDYAVKHTSFSRPLLRSLANLLFDKETNKHVTADGCAVHKAGDSDLNMLTVVSATLANYVRTIYSEGEEEISRDIIDRLKLFGNHTKTICTLLNTSVQSAEVRSRLLESIAGAIASANLLGSYDHANVASGLRGHAKARRARSARSAKFRKDAERFRRDIEDIYRLKPRLTATQSPPKCSPN